MKNYSYMARTASGERKEGVKQASSAHDVLTWLREQGCTPISTKELTASGNSGRKAARKTRGRSIKSSDLSAFCWQMTTMIEGGIPITTAIETIAEDIENYRFQQVLTKIGERVQKGESFSSSVAEHPNVFNTLSVAMITAGETSGSMPETLKRLAEYYDNRDKLAKKVKGAMAYPVFVLIFIVVIIILIMTFIIPRFKTMFDQIGTKLPAFTRSFMGVYDMLRSNLIYIAGLLVLAVAAAVWFWRTQKGHYLICKALLRIPLIGNIIKQTFVATFCRTMSTLLATGVSVLDVFNILSTMTTNDIIKNAVVRSREQIVEGLNISTSMSLSKFFPNMVVKMIQVGEESGSLSRVLDRTSDFYERKVESTINTAMSLLEPIMIVSVGAIVLVVVVALYLPIFSMSR